MLSEDRDIDMRINRQQSSKGAATVLQEKERILKEIEQSKENTGLRVIGVAKQYNQSNCCKKKIMDALKSVLIT